MKKIIARLRDLRYRRRIKKWLLINIKLACRKTVRFLKSEKFKRALTGTPTIVGYVSAALITVICVGSVLFVKYVCPFFDDTERIVRRLSLTEYDSTIPYLSTLDMLGSSNRIQVTLRTDDGKRFGGDDVGLDRGNINLMLTFADGEQTEYSLNNTNYDNFEAGMTDTFTVILPFGKTPFDITEYRIVAVPDINNKFDNWSCRWARVYFLLGDEPVLLAKESWDSVALFGTGDTAVKQSTLAVVSDKTTRFTRANELYGYFLKLKSSGITDAEFASLKADTLEAVGLNSGNVLNVNIETANIEVQNNVLTYYTKGVDIPEYDSLDYDGMMYLDVTFYTRVDGDSYVKSYPLDTLGTDDFELGATSQFRLDMPEGMTVFDISAMSLRAENPYDAWAPRYIRIYVDTDYGERLEFARITDKMLINTYSTSVFYNNLIDSGVNIDLSSSFCISQTQKKQLEEKNGYSFGERISKMYYDLQSFFDRQTAFFAETVNIYTENAKVTVSVPKTETAVETPEAEKTPTVEETPTVEQTPSVEQTPTEEETPTVEQTPDVQEIPSVEVPTVQETPSVETPTADNTPTAEEPVTETPAVQQTPAVTPEVTEPEQDAETMPEGIPTADDTVTEVTNVA